MAAGSYRWLSTSGLKAERRTKGYTVLVGLHRKQKMYPACDPVGMINYILTLLQRVEEKQSPREEEM